MAKNTVTVMNGEKVEITSQQAQYLQREARKLPRTRLPLRFSSRTALQDFFRDFNPPPLSHRI